MIKTKIFLTIGIVVGFLLMASLMVFVILSGAPITPPAETTVTTTPGETVSGEAVQPPPALNPFTTADFGYEGDYLTCLTAPSIRGIDISSYQTKVDWEQVKNAGFEFVFIRIGGRGYGEAGKLYADKMAQSHYEGAKSVGMQVGCYFFSQALNTEEAIEEADYALELIKDWELDLPVVFDWECLEDDYRTADTTARELTDCAKAFCKRVQEAGRSPMVYFNANQSHKDMYLEELTDYPFWLAMYTDQMRYPFKVDFWQYTNEGTVPGIPGTMDINLMFPTPVLNTPET